MLARIIHDFDPFLLRISGNFGIRWYALPYLLGFLLAWWVLLRAARRGAVANLDEDGVYEYLLWLIGGVLVGARFFHVFVFEYASYGLDPVAWIAVWHGGMAFHGGLVGAATGTWLFCRRRDVPVLAILDRLVIPAAFALGLGRIANFVNGEMYGVRWDGPFCVDYTHSRWMRDPPEGCRHPVQLYEWLKEWTVLAVLWLEERYADPRPGALFWTFVAVYGLLRFPLMYLRVEPRVWAGMTLSQIFSAVQAVVGLAALAWIYRDRLPWSRGREAAGG